MTSLPNRGLTFVRDIRGPVGAPVVLLLHGWTATADLNWSTSFTALSRHFRVIALDHRGHGRGIRSAEPFTLEACADDAAALLRELGVSEAIVVGYSMGGPIAQLMWKRHRDLVRALVLCATSDHFSASRWESVLFSLIPIGTVMSRYFSVPTAIQALRAVQRRTPNLPIARLAAEAAIRHDWHAMLEAVGAIGRFDSRSWVRDVDVPTAVVVTTSDHIVRPKRQLGLSRAIEGALVFEVPGDHDVCLREAGVFVPVLVSACTGLLDAAAEPSSAAGAASGRTASAVAQHRAAA